MFRKTLSELTEVDNKLIRTFLTLAIVPKNVINDNDHRFTSPVKYLVTTTGGLWLLEALLSNVLDDRYPDITTDWTVSSRFLDFLQTFDNIQDEFTFLIAALAIFPLTWLSTKLLFFKHGTWDYFLRLAIFLTAQLSTFFAIQLIMSLFPAVSLWLNDIWGSYLTGFLLIGYLLHFFLNLKFSRWYLTLPKTILVLFTTLYGIPFLLTYLQMIPVSFLLKTDIVYPLEEVDIPIKTTSILSGETFLGMSKDEDHVFFIDQYGVGKIENEESRYFLFSDNAERKLIPESDLILVSCDSTTISGTSDVIKLFDYSGSLVFEQIFDHDLPNEEFELLSSEENRFEILIPDSDRGNSNTNWDTKMAFFRTENGWSSESVPTKLPELLLRKVQEIGKGSIGLIAIKPGSHWANVSLSKFDSANRILWKTELYDKTDVYDLKYLPRFEILKDREEIIAEYSIPNDTAVAMRLFCLNFLSGEVKWETQKILPVDDMDIAQGGLLIDQEHIYLIGNADMSIRKKFWDLGSKPIYMAKFSLPNGEFLSQKFLGRLNNFNFTYVYNSELKNDEIHLLVESFYTDFLSIGGQFELAQWQISTSDI
ncbi:MAG: hypothetical protein RJQ09_05940 [Cyclobacteriaceae bacterium]